MAIALLNGLIPTLLNGLSLGIIYTLSAVGLTLIFGFLGVVNFAHGAFYMVGGYLTFAAMQVFNNFIVALIAAICIVVVLGLIMERTLLQPTYDLDPITQMLLTVGVSYIAGAGVIIIWGETGKSVTVPDILQGSLAIFGITYPIYRLTVTVLGIVIIFLIWVFLRYTRLGLVVRASLFDKEMVRASGFRIEIIYAAVFASGVALAALAGGLVTPLRGINPLSGDDLLLNAFIIVVIGGLGSFRGTIIAGIGVGLSTVLLSRFVSTRLNTLVIFIFLLAVLIVRPNGLFGEQGALEDA